MNRSARARLVPPAVTTAQQVAMSLIFACLFLFWLTGFVALRAGISGALRRDALPDALAGLLVGHVLIAAFPAAAAAVVLRLRRLLRENRLRAEHPTEPWMWRTEWSSGLVSEVETGWRTFILVAAVVWNVLAAMMIVVVVRSATAGRPPLLLLISPAIGLVLIALVAYERMRVRKYGKSTLRLESFPIVPGEPFRGELRTRCGSGPEQSFSFRLTCVEERVIGHRRDRMRTRHLIWSDERTVGPPDVATAPGGVRVPFSFAIPGEALESEQRVSGSGVRWTLRVHAASPGIGHRARFELPVFDPARQRWG